MNCRGPLPAVYEAVSTDRRLMSPPSELEARLRRLLSSRTGLPGDWFLFADRADDLLSDVMLCLGRESGVIRFGPGDGANWRAARRLGLPIRALPRDGRFAVAVEPDVLEALPPGATAVIGSPSDPSGTMLSPMQAVRLSRGFAQVLVDERHGGFGGRSLVPYVREWENLLVLQSFENWAGLDAFPLAYLVGRPAQLKQIARVGLGDVSISGLAAASVTLEDAIGCQMLVRRAREDRSRLYRTLRKLSIVQPLPSLANYLLARIELSSRDVIARGLLDRGIVVHVPEDPAFGSYLRITAGTPEETDILKRALIEVMRAVV